MFQHIVKSSVTEKNLSCSFGSWLKLMFLFVCLQYICFTLKYEIIKFMISIKGDLFFLPCVQQFGNATNNNYNLQNTLIC